MNTPLESWDVTLDSAGSWSTTFDLPVHAESIGFRATSGLTALRPTVTVRPVSVLDARHEPERRAVERTARYERTSVFFHDEETYPEERGFWTRGGATSEFTLTAPTASPPRLRLRAGPVPLTVRVALAGGDARFSLAANESREVEIRAHRGRAWRVSIETAEGFVPAERDPQSTDRRRLGCWVEVVEAP
jgi:hypothetical protein